MGVKKFIKTVLESLNIKDFEVTSKKKSLKTLLCKLKKRRVKILKELKTQKKQKNLDALHEELDLISIHIKNAKEKLNTLTNK